MDTYKSYTVYCIPVYLYTSIGTGKLYISKTSVAKFIFKFLLIMRLIQCVTLSSVLLTLYNVQVNGYGCVKQLNSCSCKTTVIGWTLDLPPLDYKKKLEEFSLQPVTPHRLPHSCSIPVLASAVERQTTRHYVPMTTGLAHH